MSGENKIEQFAWDLYCQIDIKKQGGISKNEIAQLCVKLGIIKFDIVKEIMAEYGKTTEQAISVDDFVGKLREGKTILGTIAMFCQADLDHDGKLNFEEFYKFMGGLAGEHIPPKETMKKEFDDQCKTGFMNFTEFNAAMG